MGKIIDLRKHLKKKKESVPVDPTKLKAVISRVPIREVAGRSGESQSDKKLFIYDKRSSETFERKKCFECGTQVSHSFMYQNTSVTNAKVYLCVGCKELVLERSFGKTDALRKAILVGHVESNRRKH